MVMGFDAPLAGELLEAIDGRWSRVHVSEARDGFNIVDRRAVKISGISQKSRSDFFPEEGDGHPRPVPDPSPRATDSHRS